MRTFRVETKQAGEVRPGDKIENRGGWSKVITLEMNLQIADQGIPPSLRRATTTRYETTVSFRDRDNRDIGESKLTTDEIRVLVDTTDEAQETHPNPPKVIGDVDCIVGSHTFEQGDVGWRVAKVDGKYGYEVGVLQDGGRWKWYALPPIDPSGAGLLLNEAQERRIG